MYKPLFRSLILMMVSGLLIMSSGSLLAQKKSGPADQNWPQWRGPFFDGANPAGNPPVEFSETKNIKWKTEIPGKGHATPLVWGDQMILLTSLPTDKKPDVPEEETTTQSGARAMSPNQAQFIHEFRVISVNRNTGAIQWEKSVREEYPLDNTHQLGSWASNSPVTDGEHIYAYFGSRGLYCLDFKGNVLWEADFGQMQTVMSFGEGSSPVLYKDKIIVVWDHEAGSFITALDKKTGKEVWKSTRDEGTAWATPLIVEVAGKPQVVTCATRKIRSYDPDNGELLWECAGLTRNVIPCPVEEGGILYVMSGYRGNALMAIDLAKAKGDITGTDAIVWTYNQNTPYTPSPVLMDGKLYFLRANNGELTCLDAKDGKVNYSMQKVEGIVNTYSSPTGVKDHLYIAGDKTVAVIKAGPEFKQLATNTLDDVFEASPVVIGDELYLRGARYLYCIAR